MPQQSIDFSEQELSFILDQQFLLSKIEIGKKMEQLLGKVEQSLYDITPQYSWPSGVLLRSGKISKGENYKGLPYFILDYPRRFDQDDVFAFRTMFWWGNFFSATLHLSGKYLEMSRAALRANAASAKSSEAYICTNSSPWEYHYERDNYHELNQLSIDQIQNMFDSNAFIKLSYWWGLQHYRQIPSLVPSAFQELLSWMVNWDKK